MLDKLILVQRNLGSEESVQSWLPPGQEEETSRTWSSEHLAAHIVHAEKLPPLKSKVAAVKKEEECEHAANRLMRGLKPMVSMGVMHGLLQQMEDAGADGEPQQVKEEGEAQFFSRKDTQQRSRMQKVVRSLKEECRQVETQRGSSEAKIGGAEGTDGAMDGGDSATGGCRSEETGCRDESDEGGVGDSRSHDERVRLNGHGHKICRTQGLPRLGDVRVCQEEMGSSERGAAVGSFAGGDPKSKSECSSNVNLQRCGVDEAMVGTSPRSGSATRTRVKNRSSSKTRSSAAKRGNMGSIEEA